MAQTQELQNLSTSALQKSKGNLRVSVDKNAMKELVASVKAKGILVPLLVRPIADYYEIVCGHCRFAAAQELKLQTVPAIVKELTDEEALEYMVVENEQRQDVHPLEQSVGYQRMAEAGLDVPEIAKRTGRSPAFVYQRLRYNNLIEAARKKFLKYEMWVSHADQLARLTPDQQKEIMRKEFEDGMSPHDLADAIARNFFLRLKDAPFDPNDEKLVPKAGSCLNCPKRTGFSPALFADIKDDTCTDPKCFQQKCNAFVKIAVGTHPDAVLLTVGSRYGVKPKGETEWTRAGDKKCEYMKEGVVVEVIDSYVSDRQQAKLGQSLQVCLNDKCKIHHPTSSHGSTSYGRSEESKKAEKQRRIELRRRALVFKELASTSFRADTKNRRDVLRWAIDNLSHDTSKAFCDAMGWEVKEVGYRRDYNGMIAKQIDIDKRDNHGIDKWLFLVMLSSTELWYANGYKQSAKELDAKAKFEGVKLADCAKLAKNPPRKPKAAKAKPKAA